MSLLGLAGYGSDHSEVDDAQKQPKDQESTQESINSSTPAQGETASGGSGDLLEGTTDVRQGGSLGDEGGSGEDQEAPGIAMKSSPVDAPQRLSKEPKPFFMPLPSPLVRIDNASQGYSSTLAMQDSSPNEDSEAKEGEGEEYGEGEQGDVDVDIIKPEFRGMLPPEATGQANAKLQSKIATFLDTIQGDFTKKIKSKKDYGNPAVLAQICQHCKVDDKGTNYPEDRMVHPSVYDIKDFYESLMNEYRKAKRPEITKQSSAATVAPQIRPTATSVAVARGTVDASASSVATTIGNTRKRVNKWGSAPPLANGLPFMGQQMKITATSAAAAAAAAAAAVSTAGRVGFSTDPATTARAGQTTVHMTVQTQAAAKGKDVQQQQVEQLARVQQLIADRVGKAVQEQSTMEQPAKKPRLQ